MNTDDMDWTPSSCTLPVAERPLRTAEFDALFADAVLGLRREEPTRLRLELRHDPEIAARAAELAARETECCGFFTFRLTASAGTLRLDVSVPTERVDVLAALAARTAATAGLA